MRVIPPLAIAGSVFTSSTCAEPHASETAYNAGTTYAVGDTVIVAADHRTYESLQAGNVGHTPIDSPSWWIDVGPTLRWAMFDLYRNTQTIDDSPLTVTLTPGVRINSIALLGLEATEVNIDMDSVLGGVLVYSETFDLNTREVLDWYDYFFEPFSTRRSMVVFDLPPYTDAVIGITITNTGGNAACGALVIGSFQHIGTTETDAESDALNFSVVERDEFGSATLVPRRSIPKTNQRVFFDKSLINAIRDLRTALNAKPAVWSSMDDESTSEFFEALLILGIYKSFKIRLADPMCTADLELEEI